MNAAAARVDAALGRVPMLRLVAVVLAAISLVALVLSLDGALNYSTATLLATLVAAVGASVLGDRLMAGLARARPVGESAIVTGLILFLVVFPSTAPSALLLVAGAALVANASKYLVRVGGRHVLNPAATGLVVAGLTGLTGSAWWVGTPVLLPALLVGVVLVAVRMRLVGPVALLVVLGGALQTGVVVAGGTDLPSALALLPSTPLLFLAGFMFTEPITLPPRRGQRYAEAALVAVLLALPYLAPFSLGTLRPTPELALLVGNVFALVAARPSAAGLRLVGRRALTPTAVEYAFQPDRPLRQRAGQYLELHLPHRADRRGARRSLTIVSVPQEEDGTVRVAVRIREPASSFKRTLDALEVGGTARAVTVTGGFTLPDDRRLPLLLLASGIGITPFVSQLRQDAAEVADGAPPRDVLLVDRVPSADEVPYLPELAATGVRVLLVCPDPEALPPLPDHWHVARTFDAAALAAVLPEPQRRVAAVSGSPRFLGEARAVLRELGVRRVRTDAFAGY
ncbi:ferredoxin--NADP reductase [Amnibacterium kyonggiense]|uniref:Ferredoxin-NADP reductase n=1 Tax=Amnibacterium kyonggiense TaxID=595671 RepID=A0A4R7FG32_9MICO|nr:oxidoreductase [Amnibacterium kyonggiense]TDS75870.1 ferredoxin-NADP reductase [Amnibacterium kyonggiense]